MKLAVLYTLFSNVMASVISAVIMVIDEHFKHRKIVERYSQTQVLIVHSQELPMFYLFA